MCWRSPKIFFARGSTGAGVAFTALRRGHVDAGEKQSQVRRGELKAGLPRSAIGAGRGIEFLKGAGLESLVPDDQAVWLPEEDLDAIAAAVEEQEEMSGERILPEMLVDHSQEAVEALAHVGGPRAKKDAHSGGEVREHQLAPLPEPTSCPAEVIAA